MNQRQTDWKSGHWGHDEKNQLGQWAKRGYPKIDPRWGSFAFTCCNIILIFEWYCMHFCKGRKTFEFLQAEKCESVVDLHRTFQTEHPWVYGMDKVSQRGKISHIPGGGKPQHRILFPFSDHSLSQRGMGWCHVPSAWQTAVKDFSFWSPYMGEKSICWFYRAFNSFPKLKYYSMCLSFHCCPIFAPLQSVPVAVSSCLPSILYLPHATQSS